MKLSSLRSLDWHQLLLALIAGALLPLAFAPFDLWPVALLSVALLTTLLRNSSTRTAFWRSWSFGLGMYGSGISWVYVSINEFGNAGPAFAVLLTVLLVVLMASLFALPFLLLGRWLSDRPPGLLLGLPALWVAGEWLRTWLFTGFPWLYLGYGHLDSWLAGWAPVVGVMGVSLLVAFSGATLAHLWLQRRSPAHALAPLAAAALLWLAGFALQGQQWTSPLQEPISVGIAQGNIPQEKKWDPAFLQPTLDRYFGMSDELWDNDWVVWPEAAMPLLYNQARPYLDELKRRALESDAALITGVLYDTRSEGEFIYYNSIIGTGLGSGIYHKQRLVPFGDYVPLRDWFGPVLAVFDLPMSVLRPGPSGQKGLQVAEALIAPSICYEIAYPDMVAEGAAEANVLITISNDAWFGASIGPLQHMQIAQMRALETGRYLVRATNNGVSALVDERGQIIAKTDRFIQQTLEGEIELRTGLTPFMRWGSEPVLGICLLLFAAGFYRRR